MGEAHRGAAEQHVVAMVAEAALAFLATPARQRRVDGDEIAGGKAGHASTQRGDRAGCLMAEDHRFAQAHGAEAAIVVVVQVRAADASCGDMDEHLAFTGTGLFRVILKPEVMGCMGDDGAHCKSPQRTDSMPPSTKIIWPLT